jgi:hypothetical protein
MKRKSIFLLLAASFIFLIVIGGAVAFSPDIEEYKTSREDNFKDKIVIGTIYIECDGCKYGHILSNRVEPYCSKCGKHFTDCKVDLKSTVIVYYCPFCNGVSSIRDKYCGHCGKSLEEVNKMIISNLKSDRLKYK